MSLVYSFGVAQIIVICNICIQINVTRKVLNLLNRNFNSMLFKGGMCYFLTYIFSICVLCIKSFDNLNMKSFWVLCQPVLYLIFNFLVLSSKFLLSETIVITITRNVQECKILDKVKF